MSVEKYISPFIQNQFPEFYREYGPNFIAFVRAYYEWMEATGNPLNQARTLYEYADIDTTLDTFVKYFKNKYMLSIPQNTSADQRLLTKHIIDLYRSKGSLRAYELLFRILFNQDIEVYVPGNDLFRLSNNKFVKPVYIEVSDSEYHADLIGRVIRNSDNTATAVVDNYYTKLVNNKILNILVLSDVYGSLNYGSQVLCDDLYINSTGDTIGRYEYDQLTDAEQAEYSLALTNDNAAYIVGSLSGISIVNGGANFNVGDILRINGDGLSGQARVASVRDENGKVTFTLLDGGSGFSVNAAINVTGGGGSGATFRVGGLVDKEIFLINTDIVGDYYNTQLDDLTLGCNLTITGISGTFNNGDTVHSTANVTIRCLDTSYSGGLSNGEALYSNTLNINMANTTTPGSNLTAYHVDGSILYIVGSEITNANLVSGITLTSNVSGTLITVNNVLPTQNTYGNGTVADVTGGNIQVVGNFGYFVPGYNITTGAANATVTALIRNTDWPLPETTLTNKNLDQIIGNALNIYELEVGTITYLSQINPGNGYASDPTVSILEPEIYALKIPDKSGFKGFNASVTAKAGTASGIVTSVDVYDAGFGYTPISTANLESSNTENQTIVSGRLVIDTQGIGSGEFTDRSGFLSDTQHVIDSKYWQMQSYDIIAPRMMKTYEKFVRELVHPAGIALFGTYKIASELENETATSISFSLNQT